MNKLRPLLALLLAVSLLSAVVVSAHPFVDIPSGEWYEPAVQYVYEHGLMNGTSSTTFDPNMVMDRAMVVTVLYRMAQEPETAHEILFEDVHANAYYYDAVCWAYQNNIVTGFSATEFAPHQNISRAQMVAMLYRCYGNGYVATGSDLSGYTDSNEIPSYSRDAFAWAIKNGIITGTSSTTLHPSAASTRAQCATVLYRLARIVDFDPPADVELRLDQSYVKMTVGDTMTLKATYNGNKPLTWKSSDEITASVNNGVVTAHEKGITYITVSDGDHNAVCKIEVDHAVGTITIDSPKRKIYPGETYQFTATVVGNDTPNLTWGCSDNATIDQNGLLTAIQAGSAWVQVTDGKTVAQRNFIIYVPEIKTEVIEIVNTDGPFYDGVTRYNGDYVIITAINKPNEVTRDITAKSNNTNVVEVSDIKVNGNYRKITLNFKSAGTATITLTSGDKAVSQSYTITIKDDYDFNPGNRQLTPEEFADYTTKVMCANGFTYNSGCTSWRQMTLSKDELNFNKAVSTAYARMHEWWPNGCRYCQIVYIGQNDNGDFVFHTCWG